MWPETAAGKAQTDRLTQNAATADGKAVLAFVPPGDVLAHNLQRLPQPGHDNHGVLTGLHQQGPITRLAAQAFHQPRKTQFSVGASRYARFTEQQDIKRALKSGVVKK